MFPFVACERIKICDAKLDLMGENCCQKSQNRVFWTTPPPADLEILMDHGSELAQNTPSPSKIRTAQEGLGDFGSELGKSLHAR